LIHSWRDRCSNDLGCPHCAQCTGCCERSCKRRSLCPAQGWRWSRCWTALLKVRRWMVRQWPVTALAFISRSLNVAGRLHNSSGQQRSRWRCATVLCIECAHGVVAADGVMASHGRARAGTIGCTAQRAMAHKLCGSSWMLLARSGNLLRAAVPQPPATSKRNSNGRSNSSSHSTSATYSPARALATATQAPASAAAATTPAPPATVRSPTPAPALATATSASASAAAPVPSATPNIRKARATMYFRATTLWLEPLSLSNTSGAHPTSRRMTAV